MSVQKLTTKYEPYTDHIRRNAKAKLNRGEYSVPYARVPTAQKHMPAAPEADITINNRLRSKF